MNINLQNVFLKPFFIVYLLIGLLAISFLSVSFAQLPTCKHGSNATGSQEETDSPYISQTNLENKFRFGPAVKSFRYVCDRNAPIFVDTSGLRATADSLKSILQKIGDPNLGAWSVYPEYKLTVRAIFANGRDQTLFTYDFVKPGSDTIQRFSVPAAGDTYIEFRSEGIIASDGFLTQAGLARADRVVDVGLAQNRIHYAPRYSTIADPCRYAFKVNVAPSRINLGSQTIKNFGENVTRKANFSITASRRHYAGCGKAAEPILTLIPDGNNIDNLGVMKLDNGTEILVEDDSGAPVIFNRATSMGGRLEMGSHVGAMSRVIKSYRLTWRRIPGEQLVTGKFQKVLRANVEFR